MSEQPKSSGRRAFLGAAAAALFAGISVTLLGCDDDKGTGAPAANSGDMTGQFLTGGNAAANHGHAAVITKAQLQAGGAVTLDIRGSSGHTHSISLTAEEMASLKAGSMVNKDSSSEPGHFHTVMFM